MHRKWGMVVVACAMLCGCADHLENEERTTAIVERETDSEQKKMTTERVVDSSIEKTEGTEEIKETEKIKETEWHEVTEKYEPMKPLEPTVPTELMAPSGEGTNTREKVLYLIAETDDYGNKNYSLKGMGYELNYPLEELENRGAIIFTNRDVISAMSKISIDGASDEKYYQVVVELSSESSEKFYQATKRAFYKAETIAVYYDGHFISVPKVYAEIDTGECNIPGFYSLDDAEAAVRKIMGE